MEHRDAIIAALKKSGPQSPRELAGLTGIDLVKLKNYFKGLVAEGVIVAAGATSKRVYGLPDQELPHGPGEPRQGTKHRTKKKGKKPAPAKPAAAKPNGNGRFIAGIAADERGENCLLLIDGVDVRQLTREQTLKVADVILKNFEAD